MVLPSITSSALPMMMNVCDPSDPQAAIYFKLDPDLDNARPESVVLLVPRCCQLRQGTTDRKGINDQVRKAKMHLCLRSSREAGMGEVPVRGLGAI